MKILCLSDTHLNSGDRLPHFVRAAAREAELILHAGDLTEASVLDELESFTRVEAVAGNMDSTELKTRLPRQKILTLGQHRIGLSHGGGNPRDIKERVCGLFPRATVIVFGHTHRALIEQQPRALVINPGSPTEGRWSEYLSFVWLYLEDDKVHAEIIKTPEV